MEIFGKENQPPKADRPDNSEAYWTKTRGARTNEAYFKNLIGNGADTLVNMIFRKLAAIIDDEDEDLLELLGWHHASHIYNHLQKTETFSLRSYIIFCAAFPTELAIRSSFYTKSISAGPKTRYIFESMPRRLANLNFHGLTFLEVGPFDFQPQSLYTISKISSLAVLVLHNGLQNSCDTTNQSESWQDYTVRKWIDDAAENQKMPNLRVLVFRHFDLTDKLLGPLTSLAQVQLVNLTFKNNHVGQNYCARTIGYSPLPLVWENIRMPPMFPAFWRSMGEHEARSMMTMLYDIPRIYRGLYGPVNLLPRLHLQYHPQWQLFRDPHTGIGSPWFLRKLDVNPATQKGPQNLKRKADHDLKVQEKRMGVRKGKRTSIKHMLDLFNPG